MGGERLGLLGGTFDPIHIGHLVVAIDVRYALSLDRILLVVANAPWQKVGERRVTPAEVRLAMVEAAVAGVDRVEASSIEIERGGLTYTADTVAEVHDRYSPSELFVVVGEDVAAELGTWERLDEIRDRSSLAIVSRPGAPARPSPEVGAWRHCRVEVPQLDVSSSEIRRRVAAGRPIDFLVPEGVLSLIRAQRLYAEPD